MKTSMKARWRGSVFYDVLTRKTEGLLCTYSPDDRPDKVTTDDTSLEAYAGAVTHVELSPAA